MGDEILHLSLLPQVILRGDFKSFGRDSVYSRVAPILSSNSFSSLSQSRPSFTQFPGVVNDPEGNILRRGKKDRRKEERERDSDLRSRRDQVDHLLSTCSKTGNVVCQVHESDIRFRVFGLTGLSLSDRSEPNRRVGDLLFK